MPLAPEFCFSLVKSTAARWYPSSHGKRKGRRESAETKSWTENGETNLLENALKWLTWVWLPHGGDLSLNSPFRAVSHGRNASADARWGSTLSFVVGGAAGWLHQILLPDDTWRPGDIPGKKQLTADEKQNSPYPVILTHFKLSPWWCFPSKACILAAGNKNIQHHGLYVQSFQRCRGLCKKAKCFLRREVGHRFCRSPKWQQINITTKLA